MGESVVAGDRGWEQDPVSWKDANPLGRSAEKFLLENANYGIYVRSIKELPCSSCFDPTTNSGGALRRVPGVCDECWGTGFTVEPVITPYRAQHVMRFEEDHSEATPGLINKFDTVGVFPRALKPKLGDLLLECTWSVKLSKVPKDRIRKPVEIIQAFRIAMLDAAVEREVSWWTAGLYTSNLDIDHLKKFLPQMQGLPVLDYEGSWETTKDW